MAMVDKSKLGTKQRKDAFKSQLDVAKRNHEKWVKRWRELEAVFHGTTDLPENQRNLMRSQLRIPWAWQQIETIGPRIIDPEPKFEFAPVEPSDRPMSEILNTLVRQQLNADRFLTRQKSWIEDGMVKGLGVAKIIWLQEKKTLKIRKPPTIEDIAMGITEDSTEYQTKIVTNRPSTIYVDPEDFLWDPKATNDDNWEYVFHRSWLTMDDLKARERRGIYKNVKSIEGSYEEEAETRGVRETDEEAEARRMARYAVYERWHIDGTVTTMCGDTILRDDCSPYNHCSIPFAIFRTQPTPRSLVGISEVEKIEHLQEAVWTRDNQRIDAVSLALNQVLILDPTIKGVRHLIFQPGAKIYANAGQRVEQLRLDPNNAPAFEETEAYLGAMQQMTGASPMLTGSDPSAYGINNNTATGASIMQEEANKRMAMKKLEFRIFESKIAKLMIQLNHQYISQFELQRIVGDKASGYQAPSPEEIPMFLDVIPQGMNESMSKSVERNELFELLNMLQGFHMAPFPDGSTFSIKPLLEQGLKLYDREPSQSFVSTMQAQMAMGAPAPPPGNQGSAGAPGIADQTSAMNEMPQ